MSDDSTRQQLLSATLENVIVTRQRDLVDGFKVRRVLPSARRRMVGPFIFLDQMGPEILRGGRGLDVAPHPHIGLATVTYLFEGELLHRDGLGTIQVVKKTCVRLNLIHELLVRSINWTNNFTHAV